ncbi:hypothetical protein TNCV_1634321 [Trichonephila clavipes]|nr:hypothetical protein TNCV_1634321 [Trichonephila clavipes]
MAASSSSFIPTPLAHADNQGEGHPRGGGALTTITKKAGQGHHRATTSVQERHLVLNARRHRWATAPQLARYLASMSGRNISRQTVYSSLVETGLYARRLVWCVDLRKTGYCREEYINSEHHKNGGVFFSVISRNLPDKVILSSSLNFERKWSSLSFLLRNKNRQI